MTDFRLRREEILDGDRLKSMLEESPARAAQAILLAAGEGVLEAQALLGQILLDGQGIEQDQTLALRWFEIAARRDRDWYRCSAEGGDFRGQFSYAAVLADDGLIHEALGWLRKALVGGNVSFLRVGSESLQGARHPEIRAMAHAFRQRLSQLAGL